MGSITSLKYTFNYPDWSSLQAVWSPVQLKDARAMISHEMLSMRTLNTVLASLAGFVAWRVSLEDLGSSTTRH